MSKQNEEVANFLDSIPEWSEYQKEELEKANEIERKPLGQDPRAKGKEDKSGDDEYLDLIFKFKDPLPVKKNNNNNKNDDENDEEDERDEDNEEDDNNEGKNEDFRLEIDENGEYKVKESSDNDNIFSQSQKIKSNKSRNSRAQYAEVKNDDDNEDDDDNDFDRLIYREDEDDGDQN